MAESVKWIHDIKDQPRYKVFQTGFAGLDRLRCLREAAPDVVLLAGSPGLGKSMLALQIAYQVSLSRPVIYFSIEMVDGQLKGRLVDLVGADTEASQLLVVDNPGLTLWSMCNTVREILKEHGLGLVVIDYIQIMSADAIDMRNKVMKLITEFKKLAMDIHVPVLALAQFSREFARRTAVQESAKPQLSDLGESAALEQWADAVLLMSQDKSVPGLVDVELAKNRHGPLGEFTLEKDLTTGVFSDYAFT